MNFPQGRELRIEKSSCDGFAEIWAHGLLGAVCHRGLWFSASGKFRDKNIMASNDYTKEMGLSLAQPKVPLPYVFCLIAVILAVGAYGFHATWPASHHAPAKKAPVVASVEK
jgi:hypothetical protein